FFHVHRAHANLPSFPTRRSSDLTRRRRLQPLNRALVAGGGSRELSCRFLEQSERLPQLAVVRISGRQLSVLSDRVIERSVRAEKDRKSTRLNSSHSQISYAVFCL